MTLNYLLTWSSSTKFKVKSISKTTLFSKNQFIFYKGKIENVAGIKVNIVATATFFSTPFIWSINTTTLTRK